MHSSHHKKYLVKLANTLGVCNSENMVFTNHSSILLSISITYASTAQQLGRPFLSCLYVFESVVLVVVSIMLWLQTVGCEKVSAQSIPSFLLCMSLVFIDQKKNGYIFLGAMTLLCIYSTTSTAWLLVVLVFSLTDSIDNVNLLSSSMKCSLNDFCNALFNNTFYKSYVASFPCYY